MTVRKVYVNPGEMIEFRFVRPDLEKTAPDWRWQTRPSSMLLTFNNHVELYSMDPQLRLTRMAPKKGTTHD